MSSHTPDINNRFRVIFFKLNILKIDMIKRQVLEEVCEVDPKNLRKNS